MNFKKSDLQLESLVSIKSLETKVYYPFLFQGLLYMALNKKADYSASDTDAILLKSFDQICDGLRKDGNQEDFFTLGRNVLATIQKQHLIFNVAFGGITLFDFVQRNCIKELQAFDDYFTMHTSGFSEEDIQTVMDGYM